MRRDEIKWVNPALSETSKVHKDVLQTMLHFASQLGLNLKGLTFSPITGGGEYRISHTGVWKHQRPHNQKNDEASLDALAEQVAKEAAHTFTGNSS